MPHNLAVLIDKQINFTRLFVMFVCMDRMDTHMFIL